MSENRPTAWRASLREAVVIVASILIAFGLDAWWSDFGERRAERELLVALQQEFEETLAASHGATRRHEEALSAAKLMLPDVRGAVGLGQAVELPDSLLYRFFFATTMNQSSGAIDAALRGGQISLIENRALRAAITGWPGVFEDAKVDEAHAAAEAVRMMTTGLGASGDISRVSEFLAEFAGGSLTSEQLALHTRLRPTTALAGEFGIRILTLQVALDAHRGLRRRTEAVIELIAAEVDGN